MQPYGPISGVLMDIGLALSAFEQLPIIGGFFWIFDFILGYIAGMLFNFGLK